MMTRQLFSCPNQLRDAIPEPGTVAVGLTFRSARADLKVGATLKDSSMVSCLTACFSLSAPDPDLFPKE